MRIACVAAEETTQDVPHSPAAARPAAQQPAENVAKPATATAAEQPTEDVVETAASALAAGRGIAGAIDLHHVLALLAILDHLAKLFTLVLREILHRFGQRHLNLFGRGGFHHLL